MMPRSPYPGFTPLNNRRLLLIDKKYKGIGLNETEEREMEMLGLCVSAMCHFRWPYRDIGKELKEKTGYTLDDIFKKLEGEKKP
jgi:hypothetical protein